MCNTGAFPRPHLQKRQTLIKTKSIYDPKAKDDGLRVLVTRYWPRGVRKEAQDVWFRDLGPAPELIKAWKVGRLKWDEFKKSYLDEYSSEEKKKKLEELKGLVRETEGDVTLLCTCREGEDCHRNLLKGMLGKG